MAHKSEYLTVEDLNRYIVDSGCVAEDLARLRRSIAQLSDIA